MVLHKIPYILCGLCVSAVQPPFRPLIQCFLCALCVFVVQISLFPQFLKGIHLQTENTNNTIQYKNSPLSEGCLKGGVCRDHKPNNHQH